MEEKMWEDIKSVWKNGNCTLQEKAIKYEISVADILLHAKQHDWGSRGSGFVPTEYSSDPIKLIKELTISNLSSMAMLLNSPISPKCYLDIQKTIQVAKETLSIGVFSGKGNSISLEGVTLDIKGINDKMTPKEAATMYANMVKGNS